ncbi:MAG: Hsp20/alpha crystallin family protein [Patescibacteria group bacterium]|nr:Hsp20/alpha crystallin family protein [Patescibacteria group bacterium]
MTSPSPERIILPLEPQEDLSADLAFLSSLKEAAAMENNNEGQLSVDVAETESELIVVATMAGTPKENIELHLRNDLLTIRGERCSPVPGGSHHHFDECYWGRFSRSIVLPVDVHFSSAKAEYKNGLLVVRFSKTRSDQNIPIFVVEE